MQKGNCGKILNTNFFDKMPNANNADPDQTASSSSLITVYTVLHSINNFVIQANKTKTKFRQKKLWNKVFKILGHLLYINHRRNGLQMASIVRQEIHLKKI